MALEPKSHALLRTLAGSKRPDACANIERLLDMKIPVDACDAGGFTPLATAARAGDLAVASLLVDARRVGKCGDARAPQLASLLGWWRWTRRRRA